jgi:hypothetical protein
MVLDYLNVPIAYSAIITQLHLQPGVGGPFRNLRHLEALGVEVLIKHGELGALRSQLENNLPAIVLVDTAQLSYWAEGTSHAVVVVGIEDDLIYLNDPAFPDAPKIISVNEFELAWIDLDQFYALIKLA